MSAPDQQDTATDNQDATDPSNLLYYAPRHLRDRANSLRTKQFDGHALEIRSAPSLDPQISDEPPETERGKCWALPFALPEWQPSPRDLRPLTL
jgi:hypothetical protein